MCQYWEVAKEDEINWDACHDRHQYNQTHKLLCISSIPILVPPLGEVCSISSSLIHVQCLVTVNSVLQAKMKNSKAQAHQGEGTNYVEAVLFSSINSPKKLQSNFEEVAILA